MSSESDGDNFSVHDESSGESTSDEVKAFESKDDKDSNDRQKTPTECLYPYEQLRI